jgi:hypothetical protein
MVTVFDMVSGKFLSQTRDRTTDSEQNREWPADITLPIPGVQPVPASNPADSNKIPPNLVSVPVETLVDEEG